MSSARGFPSGTVTLLFTDIEGSTRLLKQLRDGYGDLLAEHRLLLRAAFDEYGGREIDTQGDAFFVAFSRARNAVEAAIEAQRALVAHEWPDGVECRVRMGLHTGEPSVGDEGYHGIGLHRGARIAAAAHGGQVLLSSATAELVQDDLPAGMTLRDLGAQQLKDIDRPERIYQLLADGLPSEFPPLRTADPKRSRRRLLTAVAVGGLAAVAAVAAAVLATRGSGPATATAAAVSADSVGIFQGASGRLTGQIAVGTSPSAVTTGAGSIWVANVDDHSVSMIDPVKQVVIDTIQVGNGPAGIAFGGGFVWVTNGLDGTVSQIDPQTKTVVRTIPDVGNGPAGIAFGGRDVWVANSNDGTVARVDRLTGKAHVVTSVGKGAVGVAIGDSSVWVTNEATGTVTRIDPRTGTVLQPIYAGSGASAVAFGEESVWVANTLDGTVTRIDPVANAVRATIPVGDGPNGITVSNGSVWVSNEFDGTLSRIDPARGVVVQTVTTGNRPEGVAPGSGALFVAVRASGAGHRGGTLTVLAQKTALLSFDPAVAYVPLDIQIVGLTNDGLTALRKVGGSDGTRLVPDLAVSKPTPTDGGRSWSFKLRPGIRYSTGAPVRPQDFRRALERSLVQGYQGIYYARIVGAQRCLAAPKKPCDLSRGILADPAANTVTFRLTAPDPDFLYKLALTPAAAVPVATPVHARLPLPATGPYMIASYKPKQFVRLVRNPRFREWSRAAQPAGFPDEIVLRLGGSADARVAAVERGSADIALGAHPTAAVLAALRTQHASQLEVTPDSTTFYISLNTRIAPFDDRRARQAFALAVDRQRLTDLGLGPGLGQVTCQILAPNFDGYRRYCPYTLEPGAGGAWTAPDLARARRLVRASGTAGQAVTVWLPKWLEFEPAVGRYAVSVLRSLGYKARLRVAPDPFAKGGLGVQAGFSAWYADYASPAGTFAIIFNCGSFKPGSPANLNWTGFCNPAIDREIARAQSLQATDPEAAGRLWAKVDRDVTDEAPWLAFANGVAVEFLSDRVGNYQYNPQLQTLLGQLWVR